MKKIMILALCAVVLVGLVVAAGVLNNQEEPIENAGLSVSSPDKITYLGKEYPLKRSIQTVLLIGTDNIEQFEEQTGPIPDFYTSTQADFLMLLILDLEENSARIVQLNRDTMTDVPWLDVFGNVGGTEVKQLCLSYNYGDGGAKSCENTVETVSRMLFGAPIDWYLQIPMSGISVLNDLVGGVPVTMTEDLTVVDPAFEKGATVLLNGEQAERFLRARRGVSDGTNDARMERHRAYLDSFQQRAKEAYRSDSQFAQKLVKQLSKLFVTNMSAQQITDLLNQLDRAEISPVSYPDGDLKLGERYYEFYVDEGSLWKIVKTAFCE